MENIPEEWAEYARIQRKLAAREQLDDTSWGLEHALDQVIKAKCSEQAVDSVQLQKDIESRARRERDRAASLRASPTELACISSFQSQLEARSAITHLQIKSPEYELLIAIGAGWSYDEAADVFGKSPAALRQRVLRARKAFASIY